jgi:hypothetical protein
MEQNAVPANRISIAQNFSAVSASSNAAAQQTSQSSGSSSPGQEDSRPSAFMAALMSAALDDSNGNLLAKPLATVGANSIIGKGRRPNTLKQPSKTGDREALAVAVLTSPTTPTVLPLRFSLFSSDPEEDRNSNGFSQVATLQGDNGLADDLSDAASNTAAQADGASAPAKCTADTVPAAESQANSAGDLAFAARVQPAKPVKEPASAQPQPAETAAPAGKRAAASASSSTAASSTASSSGTNASASGTPDAAPSAASSSTASSSFAAGAIAAFRQNDQIAATPQATATPSSTPVEAIAPAVHKPVAAPLQNISLQVGQAGAPKVEIRLVQQSGELQVAVRTGDADLSHGLRQGLPDLVGRLQESGFRAEAWRPGGPDIHPATTLEGKRSSESSQSGDSQPGNSGSRQESGQRQQNPSRRPAWVHELEARMNNQNSTRESYGIRN